MKKAFISYSRADWYRAVRMRDALTAIGWNSFLDQEQLAPGTPWRTTLRTELISADLLVIVLTKAWVNSDFTVAELEAYVKEAGRTPKESRPVIPFEFEVAKDYLIPVLDKFQIVKGAAELSDNELCWVLHCGINNNAPGQRCDWEANGIKLRNGDGPTPPTPPPPTSRPLKAAERMQLEEVLSEIESLQRIREISWKVLGREVDLPEESKIAWYKLIKMVNDAGLTRRLCEVADVDYERLFGPSGNGEQSQG
jgi:hypothetical protein